MLITRAELDSDGEVDVPMVDAVAATPVVPVPASAAYPVARRRWSVGGGTAGVFREVGSC